MQRPPGSNRALTRRISPTWPGSTGPHGSTAARSAGGASSTTHADGESARASADLELARRKLEDAVDLFGLCEAPYERARARLALARVLVELGEPKRARAEAEAARAAFVALEAPSDVAAAGRLLGTDAASPLTRREHEVLGLVSAGRSNREIASELVVSEHTVHRHVANIRRKLGRSSRTAAVAEAARLGLL